MKNRLQESEIAPVWMTKNSTASKHTTANSSPAVTVFKVMSGSPVLLRASQDPESPYR
jgi:hypothetical protein